MVFYHFVLSKPEVREPITLTRLTTDPGLTHEPALSPDGKLLAYSSDRAEDGNMDIWMQQVGATEAIRLTSHKASDEVPTFSPDGTRIAFFSNRQPKGAYTISSLGGTPRLIAERSRNPRFSPDGKWIAYNLIGGGIWIVSSDGGTPKRLDSGFVSGSPLWSPTGQHLLFVGARDSPNRPRAATRDWWFIPAEGGPAKATGAIKLLEEHGFGGWPIEPEVWRPDGRVLFSARLQGTESIWQLLVSPLTGEVSGPPERITFGTGIERDPSMADDGPMVFGGLTENHDIWRLPMKSNQGEVRGKLERVTHDSSTNEKPSVSTDGTKMAYCSNRLGNFDVWLRDLGQGEEINLTRSPQDEGNPVISRDGTKVLYTTTDSYIVDAQGGLPKRLCQACPPDRWGRALDWARNNNSVLFFHRGDQGTAWRFYSTLDITTGTLAKVLHHDHEQERAIMVRYSPDHQWITFTRFRLVRGSVWVAPLRNGSAGPESEWIRVSDERSSLSGRSFWSPDGNFLYFFSLSDDGSPGIWGRSLDSKTKNPIGPVKEVFRLNSTRRSSGKNVAMGSMGVSTTKDHLYLGMVEWSGNIWMTEPQQPSRWIQP